MSMTPAMMHTERMLEVIKELEAERDRLAGEVALVKSAHARLYRDHEEMVSIITAERDRLKDALGKKLSPKAREKLGDLSESMIAMGEGRSLELLLKWYDESRKALGDAS